LVAGRGSWARRTGLTLLSAGAVLTVLGALYWTVPKVRERFTQLQTNAGERTRPLMWRGAWRIFLAHPAWGGGAGSYNVRFEEFRPEAYQDEPLWAHNDYLNTLADYGAVGAVLFFGAAGVVAWRSRRARATPSRDWLDDPVLARALTAGLVAFSLQLLVDFNFKIPALAMAFALVAAWVVQRAWPANVTAVPESRPTRAGAAVAAGLVLASAGFWVLPFYRAEALRYGARQAINLLAVGGLGADEQRGTLVRARADLARAVEIFPANAQAWADQSYAVSLWAHVARDRTAELGREAEKSAARALEISALVPEFWLRRGVARDMQGRWSEAGGDFVAALRLAPASSNAWFYHAYHLGLNPSCAALADAAAAFCLRLDPRNKPAQALRQRLAISPRTP